MVTRFDRARRGISGGGSRRFGWLLLLAAAIALLVQPGSPIQAQGAGARYEGVASCAGSTCHGRAEGNGAVVRQDEIATWQEPSSVAGAHSRAFAVLASPRGKQIADSLGLGPATSAPACLGCHATYEPGSAKGARFQISDGVGCESCHGPSSGWLASHYAKPATHAANIAAGLVPLERPQVRAKVCLDCHFGSTGAGQFVTHSMMAAGHPRVSFELDLFSALQQHHDEDGDYAARKGKTDNVRLWAVGQAEAVARSTDLFARPGFGAEGVFPQYYFYDCHSCHRSINDGPQRKLTFETNPGRPIPFGQAPYNDENIIMLSAIAKAFVPGRAAQFETASKDFHRAMGQGRGEATAAAQRLRGEAAALSDALAARSFGSGDAFAAVQAIADRTLTARFTDYTGSAQAVMAVDTLLNAMVRDGRVTTGAATGIRANINRAYGAVRTPESYNPAQFRSALGAATNAIGALR
ncbi:multiheme c-type cytochrome [Altererythrobacter sp. H2]|uniref:multiheme c-type cytochrome n=1 Tax=Altererythrobacter sp. H2 TaxID=3108391 RepID=UPI002B4C1877|nr:multiheme c-type cytochrome [Altererythrobacter sp. H2]WRK95694.1 multiheme c-type cytochrome [Altererythrobacter sp. H2]